jgi:hypothetical protein
MGNLWSLNPADWFSDDDSESNLNSWKKPEFKQDTDYRKTQDFLSSLGIDILGGKIPDYYKSIGETGGPEFEQMLGLQNRDISQAMLEGAAITGRRGGGVQQLIGQAVNENTAKNRWADYARSLIGKQSLFSAGTGIIEGVRNAGLSNQGQENEFNLAASGLELKQLSGLDDYSLTQGQLEGQALAGMLDLLIKGGVGFALGGPVGAGAAITGLGSFDISSLFKKAPQVAENSNSVKSMGRIDNNSFWKDLLFKKN